MANEQNLRNINEYNKTLTAEERTRNARIAGTASGKSRNLKARLQEWADNGGYQKMVDMAEEEIANGNTRMWELIRDTIGEKPVDKIMIAEIEQSVIDEVEAVVLGAEEEYANTNTGD